MNPKIGISICGLTDNNRQFVTSSYIDAVIRFGGLPLIIPLTDSPLLLNQYVSLCDGFLLCGGADITPLLFDEEPAFGIGSTDLRLDQYQINLTKQILFHTHKPVLAICRGMQVLNVACGGSIYQDISLQSGTPFNHMQTSSERSDISHNIDIRQSSLLYQILGASIFTNSYHHQTINQPGIGLHISATASDGTIEAIEMPSHPFVVGVQWHPECMLAKSGPMQHLFTSFIQMGSEPPTASAEYRSAP